ncbi:hypothetical protein [Desulfosporosinus sp. SB140]|uniref:hypothetical protein n=1 Tax=Desulfosporosinus paludis TaxID=3115649 RepID=UPI00388F487E
MAFTFPLDSENRGGAVKIYHGGDTFAVPGLDMTGAALQLTNAPLAANGSFAQTAYDRLGDVLISKVKGYVFSDAAGTLTVEESDDGSTWSTSATLSVNANTLSETDWILLKKRYFRFRYTNGVTAQTNFLLYQALGSGDNGVKLTGSLANVTGALPTKIIEFEQYVEITRPANTTAYVVGQVVNGNGLSTLPALDLSAVASGGQKIQISSVNVFSSNGAASPKLNPIVLFFNVNNPVASGVTDGTAFTPTYAEMVGKRAASINPDEWGSAVTYAANLYKFMATELSRLATLDANGKLYPAIITNNAYTPSSGETIRLVIKGYLL